MNIGMIKIFIVKDRTANIKHRVDSNNGVKINTVQVTVVKTPCSGVNVSRQLKQLWCRRISPHLCKLHQIVQTVSHLLIQIKVFRYAGCVVV